MTGTEGAEADAAAHVLEDTRSALLVLDAENRFFWERLGGPSRPAVSILEKVCRLIESARGAAVPPMFVTVTPNKRSDSPSWVYQRQSLRSRSAEVLDATPWGREAAAVLAPRADDICFSKLRMSAFVGTPLEVYLRSLSIETLVMCGVATNGAVLATAIEAASMDLFYVVASDATAGTSEELHRAALNVLGQRHVLDTDRICAAWAAS